jgi:hypothetical protein
MTDSAKDILFRNREKKEEPKIQSIILGFGHRARSGKDTVAAMIKEDRGNALLTSQEKYPQLYDIRVYSFAAELKREVNENAMKSGGMIKLFYPGLYDEMGGFLQENGNILPLPAWVQYDPDPPMDDPLCPYGKQRTLLQWWGTEYRRNVNPDYWVNKVAKRIADEKPEIALITDVRFFNEVSFCRKYGSVVKVDRPSLLPLHGAAGVHASELALANFDGWDDIIINDADLTTLRARALFSFDMLMSAVPSARPTSV